MNRSVTTRATQRSDDLDFSLSFLPFQSYSLFSKSQSRNFVKYFAQVQTSRPASSKPTSSKEKKISNRGSDEENEEQEEIGDRDWLSGNTRSQVLIFRACALFTEHNQADTSADAESKDEAGTSCDVNTITADQEQNGRENHNPNVNANSSQCDNTKDNAKWNDTGTNKDEKSPETSMQTSVSYGETSKSVNVPILEKMPAAKLNMTYKSMQAEMKLVAKMLNAHGFTEVLSDSNNYNILWTGIHLKPDVLRSMGPYQRVNHFPRSYELTRKDRLYKNIQQLQYLRGPRHFDFIPQTYVLPGDRAEMTAAHNRNRGPWIVKPVASSRGRGIYLVDTVDKIPSDEQVVVAKYVADPLLINGHKCDLRLYVLVTSMDPLLVYLYEEGLVRLATVKYDSNSENLWNPCIHLCNYSINKHHSDYVKSDDAGAEDIGHKRTLSALLRQLRSQGRDTAALMTNIEDLVIKSLLACAHGMVSACKMFQPHAGNCFELFGFDILIDSSLKPWLLEVNLSPSLGVDTPLDLRVKASLVADLLTLVGIPAEDLNSGRGGMKQQKTRIRMSSCRRVHSAETLQGRNSRPSSSDSAHCLGVEEQRMIRWAKAQYERRGGFIRIFPTPDTMQKYGQYLDPVTGVPSRDHSASDYLRSTVVRNFNALLHRHLFLNVHPAASTTPLSPERLSRYERILEPEGVSTCFGLDVISDRKQRLWIDKENLETRAEERDQLLRLLQNGSRLTKSEIRKAFGHYLTFVLRRVSSCGSDEHHCDLVLKFLQKASVNLRTPYLIKMPPGDLPSKDRSAVIAKQLSDFLYQYNRETDAFCYEPSSVSTLNEDAFDMYLLTASEADLEQLLMQQTRIYEDDISWSSSCSNSRNVRHAQTQRHVQTGVLRLLRALPFLRAYRADNKITEKLILAEGVSNKMVLKSSQAAK